MQNQYIDKGSTLSRSYKIKTSMDETFFENEKTNITKI